MRIHNRLWLVLVLLATVLSSCAPAITPVPATAPATATMPAPTAQPTSTPLPPTPSPIPPTATAPASKADFPLTVTDDLGRKVTLEQEPKRLISLAPSLTEILFAIGAGDQVVGVTKYCDYPLEAQSREEIGGFSAKTISVEAIVALEPDLVFSAGSTHQLIIEALGPLNIPVVAIDPTNVEEVYAAIELAGQLTGHQEEAQQTAVAMKQRIAAVVAKVAGIPQGERPIVYWQIWDEPLMTVGPTAFAGQLIELAGGINIFADLSESYPQISAEEVLKRNPDVIMGPDTHGDKLKPEVFSQRPGWSEIKAVRNERIYLLDGNIVSRAGPRLADALEAVAKALYPGLLK